MKNGRSLVESAGKHLSYLVRCVMFRKTMLITLIAISMLCFVGSCQDNSTEKLGQSIEKQRVGEATNHAEKKYELILSPCGKRSIMYSKFRVVSNYLSKNTGFKIELFVPRNFEELATKLKEQKAYFLYIDPAIYLEVGDLIDPNNLYVFLCGFIDAYKGKPVETGCIIARADRNIKTIKDVKGKHVIFGPRGSATKWIAARKVIEDYGIDLENDLAAYRHGGTCMDIVLDIFHGKADVGCVRTLMCPLCNRSKYYGHSGIDTSELSHVAKTGPVVAGIFTCTHGTDGRDMEKVLDALARLSRLNLQERQAFPADIRHGFVKVNERVFGDLRKMAG
jgi:ABC-type phosphate/phosphonate transport system substrate-binding protein